MDAAGALGAAAGLMSLPVEAEASIAGPDDLPESVLVVVSLIDLLSLSLEDFGLAWL